MKTILMALSLVLPLAGCQLATRVDAADADAKRAPETTAVAAQTVEACPAVPAPIECPAPEPVVKTSPDVEPGTPVESTVIAQSNEVTPDGKSAEEQTMQDQPDVSAADAAEQTATPAETFDIDKYVEQSASCVQQSPCSQDSVDDKSIPAPAATEGSNVTESPKPARATNTAEVSEKKASAGESGIQRVDRRRSATVKRETPPDMPR
jgi:hypothetical protein